MLTMDALKEYGADTQAGLARCLNDEALYLGLVEMLMNDQRFEDMCMVTEALSIRHALHEAYALWETASGLALRPLADQLEQMILCLQLRGDSAVLERQVRLIRLNMEKLRAIDRE